MELVDAERIAVYRYARGWVAVATRAVDGRRWRRGPSNGVETVTIGATVKRGTGR